MSITREILVKAFNDACERFNRLGMGNVYGKSAEERLEIDRQYNAAAGDIATARAALDAFRGDTHD